MVENQAPEAGEALRLLHSYTGKAHTIGITGAPGVGKSTLVDQLAREFRHRSKTVGIIAVDPSSPFTKGAILGDRVRMQDLCQDRGVFIRSMASRGAWGGLAETTADVITALDAFGKDIILVETVGAGQDEVEVAKTAQTILVATIPGTGDDIQAMKAGILEIAHIYVVNKADKEGADLVAAELEHYVSPIVEDGWQVPVVKTVAIENRGIAALAESIENHRLYLETTGKMAGTMEEKARHQVLAIAQRELMGKLLKIGANNGQMDS
ncbi:MAG: methylmalonyl Co-A mutase-associated GTPase MeaB [Chloroflexi bacterium]|nr:methylmalonyl Co-A mutase-associated GTPase MeaB [Chloroflexota bacterium]